MGSLSEGHKRLSFTKVKQIKINMRPNVEMGRSKSTLLNTLAARAQDKTRLACRGVRKLKIFLGLVCLSFLVIFIACLKNTLHCNRRY